MSAAQPTIGDADISAAPRHVAIIMDGNGRWAKKRFLPRAMGHREGAEAVRRTVRAAGELGISYLTLYAFSSENWKRPADEVDDLMGLLRLYLRNEVRELHDSNVRIKFIGARQRLSEDVLALVDDSERTTASNTGLTLVIALNYGSQAEIASAAQTLAAQAVRGEIQPEQIDEVMIAQHLFTKDIPDPDVIIRTSGEQRLSNFLMWQAAYAELVFVETLWPDFDRAALESALNEYTGRERRYGGRPA
jgi:undecaprenyl diphosphate synthase